MTAGKTRRCRFLWMKRMAVTIAVAGTRKACVPRKVIVFMNPVRAGQRNRAAAITACASSS